MRTGRDNGIPVVFTVPSQNADTLNLKRKIVVKKEGNNNTAITDYGRSEPRVLEKQERKGGEVLPMSISLSATRSCGNTIKLFTLLEILKTKYLDIK